MYSGFSLWDLQAGPTYPRGEAKKCGVCGHGTFIIPGLDCSLQQRQTQGQTSSSFSSVVKSPASDPELTATAAPSGPCHHVWPVPWRAQFWRGLGWLLLWRVQEQVQAQRAWEPEGRAAASPGVREAEEADERQLLRPASEHWVLHEWHWCFQQDEQVQTVLLTPASEEWKSCICI